MKIGLTGKITAIVILLFTLSSIIVTSFSYRASYKQVETAAGVELDGCASITTGIVDPDMLQSVIAGNTANVKKLENQISWTIKQKPIFKDAYILDFNGKIIAADKALQSQGFQSGQTFHVDKNAIKMVLKMRHPQYSKVYTYGGMKRITGYAPIYADKDSTKKIIAINAIDFDASIIDQRTWEMVKGTLLLQLLIPILAAAVTIFFVRSAISPLKRISSHVEKVASGKLNVELIEMKSQDEIGHLSHDFNKMITSLKDVIEKVLINSESVASASVELAAGADQTSMSTMQISESIQEIASGAEQQVKNAAEANQIVTGISKKMDELVEMMYLVNQASKGAASSADQGNAVIQTAIAEMGSISHSSEAISQSVGGLQAKSEEIEKIVKLIREVTEQTNLLALNAAIESARAGEHGKGFAVVANEVRKLADQSSQAAQQIGDILNEIQQEIITTAAIARDSSQNVHSGIQSVEQAGDSFQEIVESVSAISQQIDAVSVAIQQMDTEMVQVTSAFKEIDDISQLARDRANRIAGEAQQQTAAMEEIASTTTQFAKMGEDLKEAVARFTI